MKNQLMAEFAAMKKQNELASLKQMQLEQMLREQQAELAALREALAHKQANRPARHAHALTATPVVPASPAPTVTAAPTPVQLKTPDTSRRNMLKRIGMAVLAGGAALGVTAATYSPAEAKLSVNPTTKIGAVLTRNGASITGIPATHNYGLIASADDAFDATNAFANTGGDIGISGFSSTDAGSGVFGSTDNGNGVFGLANSGNGVKGYSSASMGIFGSSGGGVGVYGQTFGADRPAIVADNQGSPSGIALQIYQGGLTVKGAGLVTPTCAFIHKTASGNIPVDYPYVSLINNPLCNGKQNALLFVTHNANPPDATTPFAEPIPVGVFYIVTSNSVTINKWAIFLETQAAMPTDLYFNVLIINSPLIAS